jgi:lipoyl(octanoyl) transferase
VETRKNRIMVEWITSRGLVPYTKALAEMDSRVAGIQSGEAGEAVWLVEHPPLYTGGTSARPEDLLDHGRFEVHATRRGGEYTYHGPGQRVAYAMLDLNRRGKDVRRYVRNLEEWIIVTLDAFGIRGERREGRVGVWVVRPEKPPLPDGSPAEDKIAAIGVRIRKWVTLHGISLNVEPDLSHYDGIVPCGITGYGVTSLVDLGIPVTMDEVDMVLKQAFGTVFGEEMPALAPFEAANLRDN